jgi:LPXTG-motif cell wall-anchored protein
VATLTVAVLAPPAFAGQGTMHVKQALDCTGGGEDSTVHLPFALLFEGFAPNTTGTVTAFTQPGGVQVGQATVTVDALGNRCEEVTGSAPPGQYKIVYDFGSGTGKQKVIRLVEAPAPSPSPTETVTPTVSPTTSESATGSESPTETSTATVSESPTETSTATASEPPTSSTASPSGTLTESAPPSSATPSASSSVLGEELEFIAEPDPVGDAAARLPKTGADDVTALVVVGPLLALLGLGLLVVARRQHVPRHH